jgi:hypothetical protein
MSTLAVRLRVFDDDWVRLCPGILTNTSHLPRHPSTSGTTGDRQMVVVELFRNVKVRCRTS